MSNQLICGMPVFHEQLGYGQIIDKKDDEKSVVNFFAVTPSVTMYDTHLKLLTLDEEFHTDFCKALTGLLMRLSDRGAL